MARIDTARLARRHDAAALRVLLRAQAGLTTPGTLVTSRS